MVMRDSESEEGAAAGSGGERESSSSGRQGERMLRKRNVGQRWRMFLSSKGVYVEWEQPAKKATCAATSPGRWPAADISAAAPSSLVGCGRRGDVSSGPVDKAAIRMRMAAVFLADVSSAARLAFSSEKAELERQREPGSRVLGRGENGYNPGAARDGAARGLGQVCPTPPSPSVDPAAINATDGLPLPAAISAADAQMLGEMLATLPEGCSDLVAAQNFYMTAEIKRMKRQPQPLSHQVAAARARVSWRSLPNSEKYVWLPLDRSAQLRAKAQRSAEIEHVSSQAVPFGCASPLTSANDTCPLEHLRIRPLEAPQYPVVNYAKVGGGRKEDGGSEGEEFSLAGAEELLFSALRSGPNDQGAGAQSGSGIFQPSCKDGM